MQYKIGEVGGLEKDSTLVVEGRVTLNHSQLSEPIGKFNEDNWTKAAIGMAMQTPMICHAFNHGIQNNSTFLFLSEQS